MSVNEFKKINRRITACLPLLVLPAALAVLAAASLPATGSPLTLEQCLEIAAAENPEIAQARIAAEEAAWRLKKAKAGYFPEVGLDASAGYISEIHTTQVEDFSVALFPGQPPVPVPAREIEIGDERSRDLALTVRQPLFTGGIIKNGVRMSEAALSAAACRAELEKIEVRQQVIEAFYELAMARDLKKIAEASRKQIDSHLADARNLLSQGMIIKSDLYPIKIRKLETELKIVEADNAIARARAALAAVMGLCPETVIDITVDREKNPPWPIPEALKQNAPEREEQKIARQLIEMTAAEGKIARGALFPSIGLAASTHYGWPGFKGNDPDWDTWWQAGVSVSWNVFDMGRRSDEHKIALAKKKRLDKEREALDRRIELDRINTRLNYEEACRRRIIGEEKVISAQENFQTRTDNFRVGMASGTDYLDAHTELMTAETELSLAATRARIAWEEFLRAMGLDRTAGPGDEETRDKGKASASPGKDNLKTCHAETRAPGNKDGQ